MFLNDELYKKPIIIRFWSRPVFILDEHFLTRKGPAWTHKGHILTQKGHIYTQNGHFYSFKSTKTYHFNSSDSKWPNVLSWFISFLWILITCYHLWCHPKQNPQTLPRTRSKTGQIRLTVVETVVKTVKISLKPAKNRLKPVKTGKCGYLPIGSSNKSISLSNSFV